MRVDPKLLVDAKRFYDVTLEALEDTAQRYADQYHDAVIIPFCRRHRLRFWSGNGTWFFTTPSGKTLEPDVVALKWAIPTGNAYRTTPQHRDDLPRWEVGCDEEDLPEFIRVLTGIDSQLAQDFMGGCLGYWISDFNPSSSDGEAPKE